MKTDWDRTQSAADVAFDCVFNNPMQRHSMYEAAISDTLRAVSSPHQGFTQRRSCPVKLTSKPFLSECTGHYKEVDVQSIQDVERWYLTYFYQCSEEVFSRSRHISSEALEWHLLMELHSFFGHEAFCRAHVSSKEATQFRGLTRDGSQRMSHGKSKSLRKSALWYCLTTNPVSTSAEGSHSRDASPETAWHSHHTISPPQQHHHSRIVNSHSPTGARHQHNDQHDALAMPNAASHPARTSHPSPEMFSLVDKLQGGASSWAVLGDFTRQSSTLSDISFENTPTPTTSFKGKTTVVADDDMPPRQSSTFSEFSCTSSCTSSASDRRYVHCPYSFDGPGPAEVALTEAVKVEKLTSDYFDQYQLAISEITPTRDQYPSPITSISPSGSSPVGQPAPFSPPRCDAPSCISKSPAFSPTEWVNRSSPELPVQQTTFSRHPRGSPPCSPVGTTVPSSLACTSQSSPIPMYSPFSSARATHNFTPRSPAHSERQPPTGQTIRTPQTNPTAYMPLSNMTLSQHRPAQTTVNMAESMSWHEGRQDAPTLAAFIHHRPTPIHQGAAFEQSNPRQIPPPSVIHLLQKQLRISNDSMPSCSLPAGHSQFGVRTAHPDTFAHSTGHSSHFNSVLSTPTLTDFHISAGISHYLSIPPAPPSVRDSQSVPSHSHLQNFSGLRSHLPPSREASAQRFTPAMPPTFQAQPLRYAQAPVQGYPRLQGDSSNVNESHSQDKLIGSPFQALETRVSNPHLPTNPKFAALNNIATPVVPQFSQNALVLQPQLLSRDSFEDGEDVNESADVSEHMRSPCPHVKCWKRLRAKRGFAHFVCYQCGTKWRTGSRAKGSAENKSV